MILYILFIAVLNLGVGFALAAHLGRQYREMIHADHSLDLHPPPETVSTAIDSAESGTEEESRSEDTPGDPTTATDTASETPPIEDSSEAQSPDVDQSIEEALQDLTEESLAQAIGIAEDGKPEDPEPEDGGAADDDKVVEGLASEGNAEPEPEEDPEKACVEGFRDEVGQFREELQQAENDLRNDEQPLEPVAVEQVLSSLRVATEEYVTQRNEKLDRFEELHQANPQFDDVRARLQAVTRMQDEQIASANEATDSLDHEDEPDEGRRRLLEETNQLLAVNNQLRDELDEAMLEVMRAEQGFEDLDRSAGFDPLTDMLTRVGLELTLKELWQEDPQRSREVCVVLLDVDRLDRINQEHGQFVGDRILATIAQAIQSEDLGEGRVWARIAGQQFLMMLPDADSRTATAAAERVRQIIEVSRFQYRDHEIAVTLSCGVTMIEADDTSASLIERARNTVAEAKRYGRNRTFLHEGGHATPVVPPTLSLSERSVPL